MPASLPLCGGLRCRAPARSRCRPLGQRRASPRRSSGHDASPTRAPSVPPSIRMPAAAPRFEITTFSTCTSPACTRIPLSPPWPLIDRAAQHRLAPPARRPATPSLPGRPVTPAVHARPGRDDGHAGVYGDRPVAARVEHHDLTVGIGHRDGLGKAAARRGERTAVEIAATRRHERPLGRVGVRSTDDQECARDGASQSVSSLHGSSPPVIAVALRRRRVQSPPSAIVALPNFVDGVQHARAGDDSRSEAADGIPAICDRTRHVSLDSFSRKSRPPSPAVACCRIPRDTPPPERVLGGRT